MVGFGTRVGVNAVVMPGIKVGSDSRVGPCVIVKNDLDDGSVIVVKQEVDIFPNNAKATVTQRDAFRAHLAK
jgi:acetyltransferase-like isoleucine patch superfamily enzyme